MTVYLLKWFFASLVMPFLTLLVGRSINDIIIVIFWPSSIFLISLGAEKRSLEDILYVWGYAIGVNILLYLTIGLIIYFLKQKFDVTN